MDLTEFANKLDLQSKDIIRKAAELRRFCNLQLDSSVIGVGEVCKAIICLEIAASLTQTIFNRKEAIRLSGMSEKGYIRAFNTFQNCIGVKNKLDIRQLGIQFGCVRLIPIVNRSLSSYKDRFLASLPSSRKETADFTRPVFTAVAFYLCAKKQKLKVDKIKLIEICGTSESEFKTVSNSMKDLCFDLVGVSKEKKDVKDVIGNRDLLDVLPVKRKYEDDGCSADDGTEDCAYKKRKAKENEDYQKWKNDVMSSSNKTVSERSKDACKKTKQTRLTFEKRVSNSADGK